MSLLHRIGQKPVIAAIRNANEIKDALNSEVDHLFFMGGHLQDLMESVRLTHEANKGAFIHLDLIRGLSSTDREAVGFIKEFVGADGIITPKSHLIKEAKRVQLYGILHLFMLDSLALENALKLVETVQPDGIEIMPGVITKVIERFALSFPHIPIIASGLIQTKEEAADSLQAGATSMSISDPVFWNLTFQHLN